jgi:hypothetical protein
VFFVAEAGVPKAIFSDIHTGRRPAIRFEEIALEYSDRIAFAGKRRCSEYFSDYFSPRRFNRQIDKHNFPFPPGVGASLAYELDANAVLS